MADSTIYNTTRSGGIVVKPQSDATEAGLQEGVLERLPELSLKIKDIELAGNIDRALELGRPLHDDVKKIQDQNEDYWLGFHVKRRFADTRKIRPVENRQFFSLETMVPIVTDRPPEPVVFSQDRDVEFARSLEKVLVGKYQEDETEVKLSTVVRLWALNRIGVLKLVFDIDTFDFKTVVVRPQRLVIANQGTSEGDLPYIGELVEEPYGDIIKKFPKRRGDIERFVMLRSAGVFGGRNVPMDTPIKYWEFWTNEFVAWKLGSIILDKAPNPLYDFDNPDNNFLKHPIKPYFFLNQILTLGKTAYDDTTFSEQTKGIQDGINKINWAISDDLADRGVTVLSGDGISKSQAQKYRGESNERIWISRGQPSQVVDRIPPKVVSPSALAFKQDLANKSDDIWGTHGTIRGERGPTETATGRQLLKESDTGRTQPVSRALHHMMRRVYEAEIQVIKLYWGEEKMVAYLDPNSGLSELIKFSSASVREMMKVVVRPGSMLPQDKFVMRNEALELAGMGKIDDESLYERLGWPKPTEAAKRLYLFKQVEAGTLPADVLFPGVQEEIGRALAQSQQVGQRIATPEPNDEDETEGEAGLAGVGGQPIPGQTPGEIQAGVAAQAQPPDMASPDALSAALQRDLTAIR